MAGGLVCGAAPNVGKKPAINPTLVVEPVICGGYVVDGGVQVTNDQKRAAAIEMRGVRYLSLDAIQSVVRDEKGLVFTVAPGLTIDDAMQTNISSF